VKQFLNPKDTSPEKLEPVERMIATMQQSGVKAFENCDVWESALCALVLALEPRCKTTASSRRSPSGATAIRKKTF
jgi:hypothetical protein